MKYKKIAMFTDIHFGADHNSNRHNQDCLDFIKFFIVEFRKQGCDCVVFLGDWFENRASISVATINYAIQALRLLNALNVPIYFIIGNHDLFYRNNRNLHSTEMFREFNNVILIEEPMSIGEGDLLIVPYLFSEEYAGFATEINKHKYVFGHFNFRNFYLTGSSNMVCEHGFLHKLLSGPKFIFSGHFHKRQASDNVIYIGNPFGTNYGDAGDYDRGMAILHTNKEEVDFINYAGPSFFRTTLSKLATTDDFDIRKYARVKCLLDLDVSYSEAQLIKNEFMELFELREFILEENTVEYQEAIAESSLKELDEMDLASIDETICKLILEGVQSINGIDPIKLVQIYKEL